jgi:hypothetical protein
MMVVGRENYGFDAKREAGMRYLFIRIMLCSALLIASPNVMFGRHHGSKRHHGHHPSTDIYLHPGDAAFRK